MTQNRRIILNIVATYGRSVFAMVCGIFTSRWVLASLGQVDFGLFGVVGVLTSFVGFFNGILAVSVSRFYAFSVGAARDAENQQEGLEECRKWFNTALLIHTVVPVCLMIVGYPVGRWAIAHWLTIPPERVDACQWVFVFSCVSCFIGMINVPFNAMYFAKQYIAELTIYSFAQSVVNVLCLYYMVSHPRDWLVGYAVLVCAVAVIPQLLICIRACQVFPECRFSKKYIFDLSRLPKLFSYVGWQTFGLTGQLLKSQGVAILINKIFGAKVNAAMSVANSVNAQSSTLSSALLSAFTPVVTQACGAKDYPLMRRMAFRASKFGVLFILIFVIPLVLELPYVLTLWLKTPPAYSMTLCVGMILALLAEKSTYGHMIAMNANGKIGTYQMIVGCCVILTLPIAWFFVKCGLGVFGVGMALAVTACLASVGRVIFSRLLVGMGIWEWVLKLVAPIAICIAAACCAGFMVRWMMDACFVRVLVTGMVCEIVFLPLVWAMALDREERKYVVESSRGAFHRLHLRFVS